jgi:DNA-directed RNA polymerase specialized sigma subunit
VVEYLSWKEMLARLRERERRIIQLYVARYGWEEIKARLGVSDYYIKQAIVRAYELLNN